MADEGQESTRLGRPESYVLTQPSQPNQSSSAYKHSRVTSTVAQSFAADLDSMFGLGMGTGGIDTLSQTVEEKKQNVTSGQSELEKLEAKLRETEQRLAKVSRNNSPSRGPDTSTGASKENSYLGSSNERQAHPLAQRPTYPADRPPTGKASRPQTGRENTQEMMSNMPGAMPEEEGQTNGRDDYVMVDNGGRR